MTMKTLLVLAAAGLFGGGFMHDEPAIGILGPVMVAIFYMLHRIEVKVTKLLSDRSIFVSERELDE